jgi:acyl carrier protein
MVREEIAGKVRKIVADRLQVDEASVEETSSFVEDLGADSLDLVELISAYEGEFKLDIPDKEAEKLTTFSKAVDYIKGKVA